MIHAGNARRWLAIVALSWLAPVAAEAHPFYASLAELEWNAKSGHVEVAVKLDPNDLEAALRVTTKRHILLEQEKELDALLAAYVRDTFCVIPRTRQIGKQWERAEITWVGHELSPGFVWIYFELAVPDQTTALEISQSMLFEAAPQQVNTVTLKDGKRYRSVNCTADRKRQTIVLSRPLVRSTAADVRSAATTDDSRAVSGLPNAPGKEPAKR